MLSVMLTGEGEQWGVPEDAGSLPAERQADLGPQAAQVLPVPQMGNLSTLLYSDNITLSMFTTKMSEQTY